MCSFTFCFSTSFWETVSKACRPVLSWKPSPPRSTFHEVSEASLGKQQLLTQSVIRFLIGIELTTEVGIPFRIGCLRGVLFVFRLGIVIRIDLIVVEVAVAHCAGGAAFVVIDYVGFVVVIVDALLCVSRVRGAQVRGGSPGALFVPFMTAALVVLAEEVVSVTTHSLVQVAWSGMRVLGDVALLPDGSAHVLELVVSRW